MKTKEFEYGQMDQILAMQSVGKDLKNEIEQLKGGIKELKWALNMK